MVRWPLLETRTSTEAKGFPVWSSTILPSRSAAKAAPEAPRNRNKTRQYRISLLPSSRTLPNGRGSDALAEPRPLGSVFIFALLLTSSASRWRRQIHAGRLERGLRADVLQLRRLPRCLAHAIEDEEAHRFFHADPP